MQTKLLGGSLSQFPSEIFSKHAAFVEKLNKLGYNIKTCFEGAEDEGAEDEGAEDGRVAAIKGFRSYYESGLNSGSLSENGVLDDVASLLDDLEKGYIEQQRLKLKARADKQVVLWRKESPTSAIVGGEVNTKGNGDGVPEKEEVFVRPEELAPVPSSVETTETETTALRDNEVIAPPYQEPSDDLSNNGNDFTQQLIDLFEQLVRSSLGPNFYSDAALTSDIQEAITSQSIFLLLMAWLKEISDNKNHDNELKQSLNKALVTTYLLTTSHESAFEMTRTLLDFLLKQSPINEDLLLDTLKLQVKICSLVDDNLDEIKEFLASLLIWKETQGQEDVPALSKDFFADLDQLLANINSYQPSVGVEFLDQLKGLDAVRSFLNEDNEDEERKQAKVNQYFAFVSSYVKNLLLVSKAIDLPLPTDNLSEEERGKQEFIAKLLREAKEITAKTSGQSRQDLDHLFFFLEEEYYPLEEDPSLREDFLANLVKNAVQGLDLNKTTLVQYLTSAQLNTEDKGSYVLMHYRFFLQIIEQHACQNTLELVKTENFAELGKLIESIHTFLQQCAQPNLPGPVQELAKRFQTQETAIITAWFSGIKTPDAYAQSIAILAQVVSLQLPEMGNAVAASLQAGSSLSKQLTTKDDYKKVIVPLLGLLNKDTEVFVTQQILLLAKLDLDQTFYVIDVIKAEKLSNKELINKLSATAAIQSLPSLQLLIRLYPGAAWLFATDQFVSTIQMAASLAKINSSDIHSPLLQLLKVALTQQESELINKILLIFKALKNPSDEYLREVRNLLRGNEVYQAVLKNPSKGVLLNSFGDYQALLLEAIKEKASDLDLDDELIFNLFRQATLKAKTAEDLLSLLPVCRDDAEMTKYLVKPLVRIFDTDVKGLLERMPVEYKFNGDLIKLVAEALFEVFDDSESLKVLMGQASCPEVVARVADEKIQQKIKTMDVSKRNKYFYQTFIAQANYPGNIPSSIKPGLIQEYFIYCQNQDDSARRGYYSEFVRHLAEQQSLSCFIQSVLPQMVQKTVEGQAEALVKAGQCDELFELIEEQILPKIAQSPELNSLLDEQRRKISDCWLTQLQLETARHGQLELPGLILEKQKIINGDKNSDGQVFVAAFNEEISKISDPEAEVPSLKVLRGMGSLSQKLVEVVGAAKAHISEKFKILEKDHQRELGEFLEIQEKFVQSLDGEREKLEKLRQEAIGKKDTIFQIFATILENKGYSQFDCQVVSTCRGTQNEITQRFAEMEQLTNGLFEQLVIHQAFLTKNKVLSDGKPLSLEIRQELSDKRRSFFENKVEIKKSTTQIERQIGEVYKDLAERSGKFKEFFNQTLNSLKSAISETEQKNEQLLADIKQCKQEIEQIERNNRECSDEIEAINKKMVLSQVRLEELKGEDTVFAREEIALRRTVKASIGTEEFKKSIQELIELVNQAIELRNSQMKGFFAEIKREIYKFIESYGTAFWMPDFAVVLSKSFKTEMEEILPKELETLKEHLNELKGVEKYLSETKKEEIAPESLRIYICNLIGNNGSQGGDNQQQKDSELSFIYDPRAFFLTRMINYWKVKHFFRRYDHVSKEFQKLSEIQASISAYTGETAKIKKQLKENLEIVRKMPEKIDRLEIEKCDLTKQLEKLNSEQPTKSKELDTLRESDYQLSQCYSDVLLLVSSSLINIIYDSALKKDRKLLQLKSLVEENCNSLLEQGVGDGIYGNIVYHLVRGGTIEMLKVICGHFSGKEAELKNYLSERIKEGGKLATPLGLAVIRGENEKVVYLIQRGANPDQKICFDNGDEIPPLLWAYENDLPEIVKSLQEHGASSQEQDSKGNTLLHFAAMHGDTAMILKLLKDDNLCMDTQNHSGNTPIELLMKSNSALFPEERYDLIKKFLTRLNTLTSLDSQYFATLDAKGFNFLHHAISNRDLSLVKWFLKNGNSKLLNSKTQTGKAPLMLAMEADQLEIVRFLLSQPDLDLDGIQEVFLAALERNASKEMIQAFLTDSKLFHDVSDPQTLLRKFSDPQTLVRKFMRGDQLKVKELSHQYLKACRNTQHIDLLITYGADPNAVNEGGNTVLHCATLEGDSEKVKHLIEQYKVAPDPKNELGMTPLMRLYQSGGFREEKHKEVVNYLIEKTKVNDVARKLPCSVSLLLTHRDQRSNTLLHYVAQAGDISTVRKLVETETSVFGENPSLKVSGIPTRNLPTTVIRTIEEDLKKGPGIIFKVAKVVQRKLHVGGNPLNYKNQEGKTAVHLLVENENLPQETIITIMGFLFEYGADFQIEDSQGKTPLDYAEHYSVILKLIEIVQKNSCELPISKLGEIAQRILISDMGETQARDCVTAIAQAYGMTESGANNFLGEVKRSQEYLLKNKKTGLLSFDMGEQCHLKTKFINKFSALPECGKIDEFRLLIIGRSPAEVAYVLDDELASFPQELNDEGTCYLNLEMDKESLPTFWIDVISYMKDKRLTLQAHNTEYTLLHAFIALGNEDSLRRLSKAGVLYVTEKDVHGRTVYQFVINKFPLGLIRRDKYTSDPGENQSAYFSILQSMERRLHAEFCSVEETGCGVIQQIIAELNFKNITELEMLGSLLKGIKPEDGKLLWSLADRNGKTLAESVLMVFSESPADESCQELLMNLWGLSRVEWDNQMLMMGGKFHLYQEETRKQIDYFLSRSSVDYDFSSAGLESVLVAFGRERKNETLVDLQKYKELCFNVEGFIKLRQKGEQVQTKLSADDKAKQSQQENADRMMIYLGMFFEASELDTLAILPSSVSKSCKSLLTVAREHKSPSLYIGIVSRILVQLGVGNLSELVQQLQSEENVTKNSIYRSNVSTLTFGSETTLFFPPPPKNTVHQSSIKIKRTPQMCIINSL